MSNELKQLEFMLVRYVPDAVNDEFANIGVIVVDAAGAVRVRFTKDWRKVRCLDPLADTDMLEALEADLNRQLTSGVVDRQTLLTKLQSYLSNALQLTSPKAVLAADAAEEVETLARMYLERRRGAARETSGRQVILAHMRDAFEQSGVWALMKKIAAAQYTYKGDPLKIDCGYRPNGIIKMFHAVSLESDVDAAKVLAFSWPDIRDGIARVEKANSELTAIIEPELDRSDEAILFALATLQRNAIAVATTNELPRLAETARLELKI